MTGVQTCALPISDFKDAYDPAVRGTIEVRYAMSDLSEFFGAFSYTRADGKKTGIGCFASAGACTAALTGQFADYKQMGVELGYRQWMNFAPLGDSVRPYFAVRGGIKVSQHEILLKQAILLVGHLGWNKARDDIRIGLCDP